jgi:polysaccharide chain length determinant protein (PEP-CTERM system associated)
LAEHGDDRTPLESYWRVLWSRKWLIVLLVGATSLAILVGNTLITPRYEAFVTLHIKEPMPSVLGGDLLGGGLSGIPVKEEINTQIEILRSRSLLEEVIAREGLVKTYGITEGLEEGQRLQRALNRLRNDLSIANVSNTRLIRITVRSPDPDLAREIANSISRVFIERNLSSKRGEANAVLSFVSEQAAEVSERLRNAEEELLRYKQGQGIGVIDEETKLKVGLVAQLESSLQQVEVDRAVLEARISAIVGQIGSGGWVGGVLGAPAGDPLIARAQEELTNARMELAQLESGQSVAGRRLTELKARIEALEKQILEEITASAQSARSTAVDATMQMQLAEYMSRDVILAAQEKALLRLMAVQEEDINRLPEREINLIRLERNRRINDELFAALTKARNEAQIEAASQIANIDVVDPAATPLDPVRPNKKLNLIIGFLVSLILGVGLAFLVDHLDHTVKSEEEVRKLLRVPVLGLIPRLEVNGNGRRPKFGGKNRFLLVTRDEPNSPVAEAFKLLRTNLHFLSLEHSLKTIVVTSPIPGDGKTTIAANLSIAFASQAEKVLLVDADFRVPAVHRAFDLPESPGIIDALEGGGDFRPFLRKIPGVDNLDILLTGSVRPHSSELLGSAQMKDLVERLKVAGYDRIIFDVAPLLAATETVDLAYGQDGTLLVIRLGEADRRLLRRIRELLDTARITLLGSVLNRVDAKDRRYGYGYQYDYYSERIGKRGRGR